jgi:hypothetical protein
MLKVKQHKHREKKKKKKSLPRDPCILVILIKMLSSDTPCVTHRTDCITQVRSNDHPHQLNFTDACSIADKHHFSTPTAKLFHPETILFFDMFSQPNIGHIYVLHPDTSRRTIVPAILGNRKH